MKNLLTQHGRRWPVLAAKLASLWLAGVALLAACWLALAAAGLVLGRLDHLPSPHQPLAQAARWPHPRWAGHSWCWPCSPRSACSARR